MENISWGSVPTKRSKKTEKYSTPVMTMVSLEGKGTARKFSFNNAAANALELVNESENRVSFGFPIQEGDLRIFLRKAVGEEGFKLTKTNTLSDKKTYEFIVSRLNLNDQVENEFDLVAVNDFFELRLKTMTEVTEELTFESQDLGVISEEIVAAETTGKADLSMISEAETIEDTVLEEEVLETEGTSEDTNEEDVWY